MDAFAHSTRFIGPATDSAGRYGLVRIRWSGMPAYRYIPAH